MQIVSGWLIDRFSVYWIFAGGFFIWSTATAFTGLAGGFVTIFALRLLLGMGESVAYPAYSKIIAQGFTEQNRGLANGLIDLGSKSGPALGLMIGGVIVGRYGWRPLFISVGLISLLWLIPWAWWPVVPRACRSGKIPSPCPGSKKDPASLEIAGQRSAWGLFFVYFAGNYVWYFLLTWLPWYLVRERHYSEAAMGRFGSMAFWAVGIASLISGWVSDRPVEHGGIATFVRKIFAAGGLTGAIVIARRASFAEREHFSLCTDFRLHLLWVL